MAFQWRRFQFFDKVTADMHTGSAGGATDNRMEQ